MTRVLLRHPRIRTGSPRHPWTDALLVDDGVVVARGHDALEAGTGARRLDLPGEVVLPGLHDAHVHSRWLALDRASVDLRPARSLDEVLALLGTHAATLPEGAWLHSGRWDHNRWSRPVPPDRYALDAVCPDRVVALASADGHTVWTNSLTLRLAGITRDTPDPAGGEIVRDPTGEPTGILRESAQLLLSVLPEPATPLRALVDLLHDELLAVGVTAVTDLDGRDVARAHAELRREDRLRIRVTQGVRGDELELAVAAGERSRLGDERLRVGPVKLFSDGALGSRTAHMTAPFVGHDSCGMAVLPHPELLERMRGAAAAGFDVAVHAIGDEANRSVLDACARLRTDGYRGILRVEHAQHLRPADVPRFAALGVVASMQPTHCTADHELADAVLGDRPVASYAWRSLLDAGAAVAFGSDAPVEAFDPFHALHAAVTRQTGDGRPPGGWQPRERIRLDEALAAHTTGAYRAVGRVDVGRLVPGQRADLVAVDRDPWDVDPAGLRSTVVLATLLDGEVAWSR